MSSSEKKPRSEKRLSVKADATPAEAVSRRHFVSRMGLVTLGMVVAAPAVMSFRSVIPNVLYEPPRRFKVGALERFSDGGVFLPEHRVFVFREGETLHCIGAICSHLGCTVQLANMPEAEGGFEFHCPCHGSMFRADGTNFAGPAPRPLDYYTLEISPDDGQLIVDKSRPADKLWRLTVRS
jgi:menaquinol-cytochrome c reductase iron-sulfur subunit